MNEMKKSEKPERMKKGRLNKERNMVRESGKENEKE